LRFALGGPLALVSLLALCVAAFSPQLAAQATPDSSKPKGKNRRKKPAARKPVRKPPPPAAEIPAVVESASVWRGCLEAHDVPKLASSLGMEPTRFTAMLEEAGSSASQSGGCIAYVAATGGEAGVASVIFRYTEPSGEPRTIAFHKTLDGVITTPGVCDCRESTRRTVNLPAQEFATSMSSVSESIPDNVRWQLNILVPRMIAGLSSKRTTEEPLSEGGPEAGTVTSESEPQPIDSYAVRVVFGHYRDDERERLESVEIVDPASGKRVNGAWWLDRPDGPGVIIGMNGLAYERLLWESPVKYTRSSRGVGASTTTWRRRVPAKKGSPKSTVVQTINVPSYHLGVDMSAPRGTDVHAVGDAKVSFAGRRGGFGNLIILDHGRGYQTYYAHLSKIRKGLKEGVQIARGEMIGLVGSTGHSTAPHLHFETRKDTRYLDPFDETHQLGFWLLTADEQERLAMQLLSPAPVVVDGDNLAPRER
jgi:murein DD-endopeptidase MepM/ murein hydrolase activator NlpD